MSDEATVITLTDEQLEAIQNDGIASITLASGDAILVSHQKHQEEIIETADAADTDLQRVEIKHRDA